VVFVAYVAFGFLAVPLIVRHVVVPRIGSQLNGSAAITRAAFNPFTFGIRLEDLAVADDAGRTLLGFQRFEGDLRLLATVFRSGYHFGPALLHEPMVRGDIAEDGSINLVTLFEPMLQQLEGEPAWRLPRVVVHELAVTDGRLEFSDVSLIEPFGLTMQGLQFTVEGLDTHPDHDNVHRLTASTASGAQVTWEGVIRVDPFTSRGTIRVTDLPLAQASPYVHTLTEGQVEGGRMAAELEYEFAPAAEPRVALVRVGARRRPVRPDRCPPRRPQSSRRGCWDCHHWDAVADSARTVRPAGYPEPDPLRRKRDGRPRHPRRNTGWDASRARRRQGTDQHRHRRHPEAP
jgi:hypothetical protein